MKIALLAPLQILSLPLLVVMAEVTNEAAACLRVLHPVAPIPFTCKIIIEVFDVCDMTY